MVARGRVEAQGEEGFLLQMVFAEEERQWEAKIKMSSLTTFPFNVLVT